MDKYDRAIELLNRLDDTNFRNVVSKAWGLSENDDVVEIICLFQYCSNNNYASNIGCLTMIRKSGGMIVQDRPDLTKQIREDERIPKNCNEITKESLPVFAEWQRILDKELKRVQ